MKNIVLPLAGLVVGAAIVIAVKSGGSAPANGADQSELERQNAELRKKLQAAKQNSGRVEVIESTTEKVVFQTKAQTPEEIIAELRRIQPKADNRERAMREVIHYLTSLTKAGEPALPAIDKFLANNEDVEYEETALAFRRQQKAAEDARETGEEPRRNAADFVRSGLGSYFLAGAVENSNANSPRNPCALGCSLCSTISAPPRPRLCSSACWKPPAAAPKSPTSTSF